MFFVIPVEAERKAGLVNRMMAKVVDLLVIFVLAVFLPYPFGLLIGFGYGLLADGIHWKGFHGQSLGKKLFHLRVFHVLEKRPASLKDSILRNLPNGVITFFAMIPVWGWLLAILIGLPLMVVELYLMVTEGHGHRIGDVIADTEVIEIRGEIGV